jgi:2-keto-4-pentenoate hydratase/2-oxohepta-3-ene-1,7-dioic acid hydratase in catechol pathway
MKLIRFGEAGHERPGVIDSNGIRRDASGLIKDWAGAALEPSTLAALENVDWSRFPKVADDARLGPCVGAVGKIICIGLNYAEHAAESGMASPPEPVMFMKPSSSLAGPNDDLHLPPGSEKTDWEVEVAAIVGRPTKAVSEAEAMGAVAGYAVLCDYSERAWQLEGTGQWDKGKGYDGFAPLGPWLATTAEIKDPQNLDLWLDVNQRRMQDGNTRQMIFGMAALISYVSGFMSLQPGDIIATGTPSGVGLGRKPPVYLRRGDIVELGVDGLGQQTQRIC